VLSEVRVERGIGEVQEAGAVVGHDVGGPWEELALVAVAMLALVVASYLA
jgi:hypothetical protein